MSDEKPPLVCKGCGADLPKLELVARATKESTVRWKISPHPGELIDAGTVGGSLEAMARLLTAVGRDAKVPTVVLVKSVSSGDDGSIEFDLVVMRWDAARDRKRRQQARKKDREVAP
jgi:hypothetical protein